MVIYKYTMIENISMMPRNQSRIDMDLPQNYILLDIQEQQGQIVMWCAVDTNAPINTFKFYLAGTGGEIDMGIALNHIATVNSSNGLVFHLFKE